MHKQTTMRNYFFVFILALCTVTGVTAQDKPLLAQGAAPTLYLNHTVAPKENYYSIGRMYNVSPKDQIAPFNALAMEKGLSPGQVIKIPLAVNNFLQYGNAGADEVLVPVYHTVKEKEGLYRISVTYNKLDLETLKQWNKIQGDAVGNGVRLIVGYLRVKKDLSPLAAMAQTPPPVDRPKEDERPKPPVLVQPEIKETPKPVVEKQTPKETPPPIVKEEPKPVVKTEPVKPVAPNPNAPNHNGGVFKGEYNSQAKSGTPIEENGAANVFKSTSGWSDGRYYCLHNNAQPGTIIKITSTITGKIVYAKVLDVIPDIKQNNGLAIRISNAAAEELGVGANKFDCTLSYNK
jgi:LysM repeat protein